MIEAYQLEMNDHTTTNPSVITTILKPSRAILSFAQYLVKHKVTRQTVLLLADDPCHLIIQSDIKYRLRNTIIATTTNRLGYGEYLKQLAHSPTLKRHYQLCYGRAEQLKPNQLVTVNYLLLGEERSLPEKQHHFWLMVKQKLIYDSTVLTIPDSTLKLLFDNVYIVHDE